MEKIRETYNRNKMRLFTYLSLTMLVAFIVQFWIVSFIRNDFSYSDYHLRRNKNINSNCCGEITYTLGKFYISAFVACIMGFLEVFIYDFYRDDVSLFYYIALFIGIFFFANSYKIQWRVDGRDYLKQLSESVSGDMLITKQLLENTGGNLPQEIRTFASNLVHERKKTYDQIQKLYKGYERV